MTFDWTRFPVTVSFLEKCEVVGTVTDIDMMPSGGGATLTIKHPDNGLTYVVNAVQTQLRSQLVLRNPQKGDKVRIIYHGAAKKAPPGMNPTKEFTVEVWPKNPSPPVGTGTVRGSAGPENGPEARV